MRFKSLDLNLLVALDVLLEEQSVTRAAARLNVSQPAMSAALTRLRDYFGEPIFVLHGKRMIPTAAALRMQAPLKELLHSVEILVTQATQFDPATSSRCFRVCTSDYLLAVIFPLLTRKLATIAPHITIDSTQPSENTLALLDQGSLDLFITPAENVSAAHPAELLFEERYVVVGWSGNPALANNQITLADFYAAGHVVVEIGRLSRTSFAEDQLRLTGRERRIEMQVSSFLVAPEMVVNTLKLTVMHERLARLYAPRLDIAIAEMPFHFPTMKEMIQYHQSRENDTGLRWLIEQIKQLA